MNCNIILRTSYGGNLIDLRHPAEARFLVGECTTMLKGVVENGKTVKIIFNVLKALGDEVLSIAF